MTGHISEFRKAAVFQRNQQRGWRLVVNKSANNRNTRNHRKMAWSVVGFKKLQLCLEHKEVTAYKPLKKGRLQVLYRRAWDLRPLLWHLTFAVFAIWLFALADPETTNDFPHAPEEHETFTDVFFTQTTAFYITLNSGIAFHGIEFIINVVNNTSRVRLIDYSQLDAHEQNELYEANVGTVPAVNDELEEHPHEFHYKMPYEINEKDLNHHRIHLVIIISLSLCLGVVFTVLQTFGLFFGAMRRATLLIYTSIAEVSPVHLST